MGKWLEAMNSISRYDERVSVYPPRVDRLQKIQTQKTACWVNSCDFKRVLQHTPRNEEKHICAKCQSFTIRWVRWVIFPLALLWEMSCWHFVY